MPKSIAKILLGDGGERLQFGIYEAFSRCKFLHTCESRPPVPGTDVLANVAAKNMPSHALSEVLRNKASLLDCQIRNALGGVKLVGINKGLGRTGFQAARAGTATIRGRQIGLKL